MGDIYAGYLEEEQLSGTIGLVGPQGPPGPQGEQGPKGDTGTAATITVGTVTTGEPGTSASVVNSGTTGAAVFDFTIPRGDPGEVTEAELEAHNTSETAHAAYAPTLSTSISTPKNALRRLKPSQKRLIR